MTRFERSIFAFLESGQVKKGEPVYSTGIKGLLTGREARMVIVDDPKEEEMHSTRFAPVAPIQVLEGLKAADMLGSYHLLLAHHVLEYPERFRKLFMGMSGTIIMDNSLVELGTSQNEELVLKACEALGDFRRYGFNRLIPVLADVMGDGEGTRREAENSYKSFWGKEDFDPVDGYDLMVVLQGANFPDFCATADKFLLDPAYRKITWVGIPRIIADTWGSRERAIRYVKSIRPDIAIHLLGFSNNVPDDLVCASHYQVAGIDSAVPLRCDRPFVPTLDVGKRPADWFDTASINTQMLENLTAVRRWVERF